MSPLLSNQLKIHSRARQELALLISLDYCIIEKYMGEGWDINYSNWFPVRDMTSYPKARKSRIQRRSLVLTQFSNHFLLQPLDGSLPLGCFQEGTSLCWCCSSSCWDFRSTKRIAIMSIGGLPLPPLHLAGRLKGFTHTSIHAQTVVYTHIHAFEQLEYVSLQTS